LDLLQAEKSTDICIRYGVGCWLCMYSCSGTVVEVDCSCSCPSV